MGIKKTTRGQHVATRGWLSPHVSAVDDWCYACYVVGSVIHVPISIKVHSQPLKRFQHPFQEMEALVTAKSILSFLEMNKSQETLRRFVNQNPAPFFPQWMKGPSERNERRHFLWAQLRCHTQVAWRWSPLLPKRRSSSPKQPSSQKSARAVSVTFCWNASGGSEQWPCNTTSFGWFVADV